MKKKLLLLVLALLPMKMLANDTAFVVELNNGTTANYYLQDKPTLTMEGSKINFSTTTVQASYERDEVKKFYFINETSGVKEMAKNSLVYKQIDADHFEIIGLSQNDQITVCDMTGRLIGDVSRTKDKVTVNLSGHQKGIYLIKVGDSETIKIIRK
jgi:hypothetical protein